MFDLFAADAGRQAARQVNDGTLTAEAAGDLWVEFADASHNAGVSFIHAYDAAGGVR